MNKVLARVVILIFGAPIACGFAPALADTRPNFVVFLVDDLGWTDVGCYGSTFYETPQIDQLAAQGMKFTNGYAACPVCSPTRVSLQTGRNPARLHTTEWFGGPQPEDADQPRYVERFKKRALLPASYLEYLPLKERTLAELLKSHGYATCFAGKWHLGEEGYYPEDQGYDRNIGGHERGTPPGGYFSPYKNPRLTDGPKGEHLPDRLAEESIDFMRSAQADPFLLCLSFYSVHNPQQGRDDLVEKYRAKLAGVETDGPEFKPEGEWQNRLIQNQPVYGAMVEAVDEAIGRVLAELDKLGLAENTVVLFTSDNGGLSTAEGSPTSNLPLRAGKGWLYEGGIRVCWLVKWPGVTTAGSVCEQPVISDDILPTLLDIAELEKPDDLDGVSFVPQLKDAKLTQERELFWHYPHYSNQGGRPGGAIRAGRWKLIESYEDGSLELYDLDEDIGERQNLADVEKLKREQLHDRLRSWRNRVEAKMPSPNPEFLQD